MGAFPSVRGVQFNARTTWPSRISSARRTPGIVRQSGISPLRADTRSRRGVPSIGTGLDRNLLPKKTVLRVANTFMSYFFKFGKLQIYNIKRRLSRGGGNMADLGAGFDETWCKI